MNDFTEEPNKKELTLFLLPIICSGIFQQIYSLVNTAVVSRHLSYEAVAVIGVCSSYYSMQDFIFVGMTTGFGFYIYRCIGTKDPEKIRNSFWGAFFLNGLMAVVGIFFTFFLTASHGSSFLKIKHRKRNRKIFMRRFAFFRRQPKPIKMTWHTSFALADRYLSSDVS